MVLAELSACFNFFLHACYCFRQGVSTVAPRGQEVWVRTPPGNSLGFCSLGKEVSIPSFFFFFLLCEYGDVIYGLPSSLLQKAVEKLY